MAYPNEDNWEPSSLIAQVTSKGIRVVEYQVSMEQFVLVDDWTHEREESARGNQIVAASITSGRIALALSQGMVILMCLGLDKKCMVEKAGSVMKPSIPRGVWLTPL
jgi:hypothetical protein